MIGEQPKFMDSPYFVGEMFNWHLKPNAPKEVQEEFDNFMKALNMNKIEETDDEA